MNFYYSYEFPRDEKVLILIENWPRYEFLKQVFTLRISKLTFQGKLTDLSRKRSDDKVIKWAIFVSYIRTSQLNRTYTVLPEME